jgi:2-methylcitrate dehydratase PrpD
LLTSGFRNKRLHPGFAVHDAFLCVNLAESGVIGAKAIIEGKNGFLKAYSSNQPDLSRLTKGLGHHWVWLDSALKPYSACRMTHALIELAGNVHADFATEKKRLPLPDDILDITIWIPVSNFILVGDPTPNKIYPQNVVDGQFSAYFQVANALLYGSRTGLQAYKKLRDPAINALTSKTTVVADHSAVRGFPGKMRITWQDGTVEEKYQEYALGEVQHPFERARVEEKFFSLMDPFYGRDKAEEILRTVNDLETATTEKLLKLLQQERIGSPK